MGNAKTTFIERQAILTTLTLVGLFAANFLCVIFAVLLPVDTLSGEIESGVMQTLASKPIRRGEIVPDKWAGHLLIAILYLLILVAGILVSVRAVAGFTPGKRRAGAPADDARDHAAALAVDGRRRSP